MKNYFFLMIAFCVPTLNFSTYYSQNGQDRYLYEKFFKDKQHGFFVEIGASDGITLSNTKFAEERGWQGICIEPIPETFEKLTQNRKCICVHGCIAHYNGQVEFLKITGYSEQLSGMVDTYHPAHLARIERELAQNGGTKEIITVPCYTLQHLLTEHGTTRIDHLSIDTEGGEFEILHAIDFSLVQIYVINVENNYNDSRIKELLVKNGFEFDSHLGSDDIYVNKVYTKDMSLLS